MQLPLNKKVARMLLSCLFASIIFACGRRLSGLFKGAQTPKFIYSTREIYLDGDFWQPPLDYDSFAVEEVQRMIHSNVRKVCENKDNAFHDDINTLHKYYLHYLLVDEKNKFLYCYVPKAACTQWKKVMIELDGVDTKKFSHDELHEYSFKRLKDYPPEQAQLMIKTYKKFMFIREPFERILSAFRDKFEKNNSFFRTHIATDIIKMHRPGATVEALKNGDDLKFSEYIKSIVVKNPDPDEHWIPGVVLCQPCLINYDIIGLQESLERDAKHVLQYLGLKDKISFPSVQTSKTGHHLSKYFRNITTCHIREIIKIFEADFEMFGYVIPPSLRDLLLHDEVC